MTSTISRRSIFVVGLATLALVGCRREPDVDSSKAVTSGKDTPMAAPDTVTIVGTLSALGPSPGILHGEVTPEQSVSLRVESAEGKDIAAGSTVEIVIKLLSNVPSVDDAQGFPELDPAHFRVGRRFRMATLHADGRYYAKIDKRAVEALD